MKRPCSSQPSRKVRRMPTSRECLPARPKIGRRMWKWRQRITACRKNTARPKSESFQTLSVAICDYRCLLVVVEVCSPALGRQTSKALPGTSRIGPGEGGKADADSNVFADGRGIERGGIERMDRGEAADGLGHFSSRLGNPRRETPR